MQDFLPVTREDMKSRGWDELDFVYVDVFWKAEDIVWA